MFPRKMRRYKEAYIAIKNDFDINFYLSEYPDVQSYRYDAILHYLEHGSKEGRRPIPSFDPDYYALQYASEIGDTEPFVHYLKFGRSKGYRGSAQDFYISNKLRSELPSYDLIKDEFESDFYLNENHDVSASRTNPLVHYLQHGSSEGRRPTPDFDPTFYRKEYSAEINGLEPFAHYIKFGRAKGYRGAAEEYYHSTQLVYPNGVVPSKRPRNENDYAIQIPLTENLRRHHYKKVAAIVHGFYPELMAEVFSLLEESNCAIDIYVSTDSQKKLEEIADLGRCYKNGLVDIRIVGNRGRDIGPMLTAFHDVFVSYPVFLHIHTKKSPHGGAGLSGWREYLYNNLIGSAEIIDSNLSLLATKNVGLVFPQHLYALRGILNWGYNFELAASLLKKVGLRLSKDMILEFPSGTMFWARTDALAKLLSLNIPISSFDDEAGQVDGTLGHAIERSLLYFVERSGYSWLKVLHRDINYPHKNCVMKVDSADELTRSFNVVYRPLLSLPVSGEYPLSRAITTCRELLFTPSLNDRRRVILLVPSINPRQTFGGIATALKMFRDFVRVASTDVDFVILSTDAIIEPEGATSLSDFLTKPFLSEETEERCTLIDVSSRSTGRFPVRKNDIFFATAWWTARIAADAQAFQINYFNNKNKFIYLIQDFEPDFYGWGAMYALAELTYRRPGDFYSIINSEELYHFFLSSKYKITNATCLPYKINDRLDRLLKPCSREKIIMFYGRPATHRNLFEIICNALVLWQTRNPVSSSTWRVLSVGEEYPESWLHPVQNASVLGKLSLEQYAYWLNRSSIGISLMLSPHPSYPPLEMAEAGLMTITNDYDYKSMRNRFDFFSMPYVSEESLADYIEDCMNLYNSGQYDLNSKRSAHKFERQEGIEYYDVEKVVRLFGLC